MPDPTRPLRRSRSDRMVAGVCGGLAAWLGWDSTLVRVVFALTALFTGGFPGVLAYLVLWVVMPEE